VTRARGLFSEHPFGTDFAGEAIALTKAQTRMQQKTLRQAARRPRCGRTWLECRS
jgi:hypothetical protein